MVTTADGFAERDAALLMLHERQKGRFAAHHRGRGQGLRYERFLCVRRVS